MGRSLRIIALLGLLIPALATAETPYAELRQRLVDEVLRPGGVDDERILEVIAKTERHRFVGEQFGERAYYDMALPIGHQQTISSPYIVALMTQELEPQATDRVLEIGTGSGYQAAVLSPLVKEVYTIEIVEPLGVKARETLHHLGYENVSVRVGDGYLGWPEAAPFDKIIVTCSPEEVPQPLVDQLREGGRMIIPVGERYQQTLFLMEKQDGKLVRQSLRPTLFVPMTGSAEEQRKRQPDGSKVTLVNGGFEASGTSPELVPGWYYGRHVTRVEGDAGAGTAFLRAANDVAGRPSYLLQGLALDGQRIHEVLLSGLVRTENAIIGLAPDELPAVTITFYDGNRREVDAQWLGPFRGDRPWTEFSKRVKVPETAKEAILRIGLFGATGYADFDEITLEALPQ